MKTSYREFRAVISKATDKTKRGPDETFAELPPYRWDAQFVLNTIGPYPNPDNPLSLVGKTVIVSIEE